MIVIVQIKAITIMGLLYSSTFVLSEMMKKRILSKSKFKNLIQRLGWI